jgi:hypothetical protein
MPSNYDHSNKITKFYIQSFLKSKKTEKAKPKTKGKIKIEADRIKGDFDTFLKDVGKGATFDEPDDGEDFM